MAEQRREYYRVHYPMSDRPVLSAKTDHFEVLDVSEFGVCFKQDVRYIFKPGMLLIANICFSDGNVYECSVRCYVVMATGCVYNCTRLYPCSVYVPKVCICR